MELVESTSSSVMGTLPPTKPVLPPWGTTGRRRAWQCCRMAATCCVVLGLRQQQLVPLYLPIQSLHMGAGAALVVFAGTAPVVGLEGKRVGDDPGMTNNRLEICYILICQRAVMAVWLCRKVTGRIRCDGGVRCSYDTRPQPYCCRR